MLLDHPFDGPHRKLPGTFGAEVPDLIVGVAKLIEKARSESDWQLGTRSIRTREIVDIPTQGAPRLLTPSAQAVSFRYSFAPPCQRSLDGEICLIISIAYLDLI